MQKFYISLFCLLVAGVMQAQEKLSKEEKSRRKNNVEAANPFAKFGSDTKVATLSKGKYLEAQDMDSIVIIGTVKFNVNKNEIVGFVERQSNENDVQPTGDVPSRWLSPDPLSEEFPSWSPYNFVFNSPIKFNDPTGMAPESADWIPKIETTTDANGNVNGGRIVAQAEAGDTAETLATFLGVDQKQANTLYSGMQSSGSNSVVVPEAIAGPMNAAISDAIMNPGNYTDTWIPNQFEDNYNCFTCASSVARGQTPSDGIMAPYTFSSDLKLNYDHASPGEYKFGQTVIRFGQNETNILGQTNNFSTHAATYLGTSQNGTIYTFSKNGTVAAPSIEKLSTLQSMYGNNQGVGPAKNESGFYNLRR